MRQSYASPLTPACRRREVRPTVPLRHRGDPARPDRAYTAAPIARHRTVPRSSWRRDRPVSRCNDGGGATPGADRRIPGAEWTVHRVRVPTATGGSWRGPGPGLDVHDLRVGRALLPRPPAESATRPPRPRDHRRRRGDRGRRHARSPRQGPGPGRSRDLDRVLRRRAVLGARRPRHAPEITGASQVWPRARRHRALLHRRPR
jgi:hypothetical protein